MLPPACSRRIVQRIEQQLNCCRKHIFDCFAPVPAPASVLHQHQFCTRASVLLLWSSAICKRGTMWRCCCSQGQPLVHSSAALLLHSACTLYSGCSAAMSVCCSRRHLTGRLLRTLLWAVGKAQLEQSGLYCESQFATQCTLSVCRMLSAAAMQ